MKKITRKSTPKKDSQPLKGFATPTREEKLALLDYLSNVSGSRADFPTGREEEAADMIIAFFRGFIEQLKIGKPRNVQDIQEFCEHFQPFFKPLAHAAPDLLDQDMEQVDFTSVPRTKKQEFVKEMSGTKWSDLLEEAREDEARLDDHIRMLAQLSMLFRQHPETLDELAAVAKKIDQIMKWVPEDFMEVPDAFDQFPQMEGVFSEREARELIQRMFERTGTALRQKEDTFDAVFERLKNVNDPETAGALFGSDLREFASDFQNECQGLVERTVHEGIDLKLDAIQKKLSDLCGSQERLEKIQDQLAQLTASSRQQAEFGDMPPMPVVDETSPSKKEYTTDRERITATVDPVLFDLFHQERKARGVTVSRMQDIILWQRYGKPKLSFEIKLDESPLSAPKENGSEQKQPTSGRPRKKQK